LTTLVDLPILKHVADGEVLKKVAGMRDLRKLRIEPALAGQKYTAADAAEFRRKRPDVAFTIQIGDKWQEYPALTLWPGKGEGDGSITPWNLPKGAPAPAVVPFSPEEAKKHQETWAEHIKLPVEVESKATGMKFRLIPPGEVVGPPLGSRHAQPDRILYRLTRPYYIGDTEVTFEQFEKFVSATGYKTDAERDGRGAANADTGYQNAPGFTWRKPWKFPTDPKHPVVSLSWNDMMAFSKWLGEQDGVVYRLPTQLEWRFACRAGNETRTGLPEKPEEYGQWGADAERGGSPVWPVGGKKPNAFGLFDMVGNVAERFLDGEYPHLDSPVDPQRIGFTNGHGRNFSTGDRDASVEDHWFGDVSNQSHRNALVGFRVLRQTTKDLLPMPKFGEQAVLVGKGQPLSPQATVSRPAPVPGVRSWSVELATHQGHISSMAWSPKGDVIASAGGGDSSIRLWDRDGNLKATLLGHAGDVSGVAFSPDGSLLASCDFGADPQTLRVWDVASGRCRIALPMRLWISRLAFSPTGKEVAMGWGPNGLAIVNLDTGGVRSIPGGHGDTTPAWYPDGAALVRAVEGKLIVWDAATMKPLGELTAPDAGKDQQVGSSPDVSPDGKWIAAAAGDKLRIWDAKTRAHVKSIDAPGGSGVTWHKDSRLLAVAGEGQPTRVIDTQDGKIVVTMEAGASATWSPEGTELFGMPNNRPAFYDAMTGKVKRQGPERGRGGLPWASVLSPDSQHIATHRTIRSTETGEVVRELTDAGDYQIVAWSPRGDRLLMGNWGQPDAWLADATTGQKVGELAGGWTGTRSISWSANGKWLAAIVGDGKVRVWDVEARKLAWEKDAHGQGTWSAIWSPDGNRLATAGRDKVVRLWNAADGTLVTAFDKFPQPPGGINGVVLAWDPDSRGLWVSLGTHAAKLDTETGRVSPPENFSNGNGIDFLALAPDGDRLLAYEGYGWTVLREQDGSRRILGQHLPTRPVWHPDSRRFLGASYAFGVRAFDTRRNHRLGTLWPYVSGDNWICIGPDGHWRGSKGIEEHIVYVALLEDGSQKTYTPAEFEKSFGWKNDPSKARLLKPDR
jgi:WD40 repeat protein/formylglycine-generating enzyme required for sulfatase activity